MAGHSKWSNIKRKKGAADVKRAKQFSRVLKEISVAVKEGKSGDPEANPALRNAIVNAKGINLPKDNVERAIKKASGVEAESYEEITFEGYGPYGIAFFIECTTDNSNRTVANIRSIFNKNGGNLGTNGSLEFLFERKGVFTIDKASLNKDLEALELELIEHGLDEIDSESEDVIVIYTEFKDFGKMASTLEQMNLEVQSTRLERIPLNTVELPIDQAKKILELEEKFEDDEDVQNVFHNLEITDDLVEEMEE